MPDHSVITGTFSEAKFIKTRSVMQIVVELPIENADAAFKALGGVPQPGKEVYVAVARLNAQQEPKAKGGPLAQQAAILCNEPRFKVFLDENYPHLGHGSTDQTVRIICQVTSRAELDRDHAAAARWRAIKGSFESWKRL